MRVVSARERSTAFTLIELLIVIAIIAILALIAIPNFIEAQTRAKVSRAMTDIKTIATGYEAFRVDKTNLMLVDFWDDDTQVGKDRCRIRFRPNVCPGNDPGRGGMMGLWCPLTTPVAYLSSIPLDPFGGYNKPDFDGLVQNDCWPPYTYMYLDEDPGIPGADGGRAGDKLYEAEYLIISPGPNRKYDSPNNNTGTYDPTNGTISVGNVYYSNLDNFRWQADKANVGADHP